MQDNTNGESLKAQGWNSDEAVINGISCGELSIFLTAYITALRTMVYAEQSAPDGSIESKIAATKVGIRMLQSIISVIEEGPLHGVNTDEAIKRFPLAVASLAEALVSVSQYENPQTISSLCEEASQALLDSIEKLGQEKVAAGHINILVRKQPGSEDGQFELAAAVIPMSEVAKRMDSDEDVVKIIKLISANKSEGSN